MEAQLGEYEFAAQQETKDLLNSITTFSQAADRVAKSVEMMPANIAAQRRAALEQLMTAVATSNAWQAIEQALDRFGAEEKQLCSLKRSRALSVASSRELAVNERATKR